MTAAPRITLGMLALTWAGAALAQPAPPVPTADPGTRPTSHTPAPAPKPADTTGGVKVIQLGPDGKVVTEPPPQNGFYYDDQYGPSYEDPAVIRFGPTPELHVVRSGDTLWDICWYYFNDPWQWPKVWSFNPQVTNPHWIYPGDLIRLYPHGQFVSDAGDTTGTPPADGGGTPDVTPPPITNHSLQLRQVAFVEQSDLETSMKIDGSVEDKLLLSVGDAVYVSYPDKRPPQVGKRYSIYTADNTVKKGGSAVGAYVKILGTLEIVKVPKGKHARGVITDATFEIERGSLVGPLIREFKNVPPVPAKADVTGTIIAMLQRDQLVGEGELVFIDVGEKTGLEVGNRMDVVRRGDAYEAVHGDSSTVGQDDRRYPARRLGQVLIVEVGPKMSIGLITFSVQEMGIGDQVLMQKAATTE